MNTISCIIPMYNEASRISGVLDILVKIPSIGEIICIDDGSSDNTIDIVQKQFPIVKLIIHQENQGKAGAIKTGLQHSAYDNIFLCDADLQGLIKKEIEDAITIFFEKKADIVFLRRKNAPIHIKMFRGDILTSGERILKKTDLWHIMQTSIKNLTLDCLINKYMMENKKKCLRMPSSAINTFKSEKYGLIEGLRKDLQMYKEMDLIENKFLEQIIAFHIECGLDEPGIIEKFMQHFEIIDEQ